MIHLKLLNRNTG